MTVHVIFDPEADLEAPVTELEVVMVYLYVYSCLFFRRVSEKKEDKIL